MFWGGGGGGVFPSLSTHIVSPSYSFVCINVTDVLSHNDARLTEVK